MNREQALEALDDLDRIAGRSDNVDDLVEGLRAYIERDPHRPGSVTLSDGQTLTKAAFTGKPEDRDVVLACEFDHEWWPCSTARARGEDR